MDDSTEAEKKRSDLRELQWEGSGMAGGGVGAGRRGGKTEAMHDTTGKVCG